MAYCPSKDCQYLETLLMRLGGDIDKCEFLILDNEICQHLEDLISPVSQYFSDDQCLMLRNRIWVKDFSKCKTNGFYSETHNVLSLYHKFVDMYIYKYLEKL